MLQNRLGLEGARVLDLFAGSGSLAFEALSRGAARVVFVEADHRVAAMIEKNAEMLDVVEESEIVERDALEFIERSDQLFDLIFADPPYAYEQTPELPLLIFERKLLKKGGFLIIEHTRRTTFPDSPLYRIAAQKEFGNTRVSFFHHPETDQTAE